MLSVTSCAIIDFSPICVDDTLVLLRTTAACSSCSSAPYLRAIFLNFFISASWSEAWIVNSLQKKSFQNDSFLQRQTLALKYSESILFFVGLCYFYLWGRTLIISSALRSHSLHYLVFSSAIFLDFLRTLSLNIVLALDVSTIAVKGKITRLTISSLVHDLPPILWSGITQFNIMFDSKSVLDQGVRDNSLIGHDRLLSRRELIAKKSQF